MKTQKLICSLALTLICAAPAFAEDSATPSPAPAGSPPSGTHGGPRTTLAPADREKLRAAREKALQDPKVEEARQNLKQAALDYWKTSGPLLVAEDASLQPVIDKLQKAVEENTTTEGGKGAQRQGLGGGGLAGAIAVLSPEEREKIKAAQAKIKDNADVQAALKKRQEAAAALQKAMHDAMLAADPSLGPILEKMEQMRPLRGVGLGNRGQKQLPAETK